MMNKKVHDMTILSEYIDQLHSQPKLKYLFWEATAECNLGCRHCGSSCTGTPRQVSLTKHDMFAFWDHVALNFSPKEVMLCITGGEPLLRPDLFEIMEYAKRKGFAWGMTTNGTLINRDIIRKMKDTNMRTISVSVDGMKDTHNWLRDSDCFERVIDNVRLLADSGYFNHVQITTVLHKRNLHQLEEMYHFFEKLGIDSWRITNIEPIGRANELNDIFLSSEDLIDLFEFIRNHRREHSTLPVTYGCSHYLTAEYEMDVRDYFFQCGSGTMVASILSNGDIYSCLDIERRPELVQGNIKTDCFAEVWYHKFHEFRSDRYLMNEECSKCPEAQFCRGDSAHTWDYDASKPRLCVYKLIGGR